MKEKTEYFPFCPENKKIGSLNFTPFMNETKLNSYTQIKKLICDWTEKRNYLIQYRNLNLYLKHGLIVHKVHENISFRHSEWLEK